MFKRSRRRVAFATDGASLTEQKWKDRQDVNSIVARCLRGDTSGLKQCGFTYADVSEFPNTLQELLNKQISASHAFDQLPVEAREYYGTPSRFVAAVGNEDEKANFKKFGLLKDAVPEPRPVKVEVINPVNTSVTPDGAA